MKIHSSGIDANIEVLRDLRMRARDQRPGWAKVARHLETVVDRQFDSEGRYLNGRRWAPLSPPYAVKKKAAGFSGGILTRTGRLRRSFRTIRVTKNRLVFGSRLDRAAWHQHGTRKMPARPITNGGRRITRDINRILSDYIVRGV